MAEYQAHCLSNRRHTEFLGGFTIGTPAVRHNHDRRTCSEQCSQGWKHRGHSSHVSDHTVLNRKIQVGTKQNTTTLRF